MGASLSSMIEICSSVAKSFFGGAVSGCAPPPPQSPATTISFGLEVDDSNESPNGLSINTLPICSRQTHSTSPAPSSTNTQLSNPMAEAMRKLVKPFLTMIPTPMVYLWSQDKEGDPKWYRDMALCLLSVAFTTLVLGISFANMHPKIANLFSQAGIGCICITFFMLVASRVPAELNFVPIMCCVVCLAISIRSIPPS